MTPPRALGWRVAAGEASAGFEWGRDGECVVAEWAGILRLRATETGDLLAVEPFPGARPDVVSKLRHGAAAAFLRDLRGLPSLHASVVSRGGAALVCVGPSGAGKSTIAAQLCANDGTALLADDAVGLELRGGLWSALPSEAALWLAGGSIEGAYGAGRVVEGTKSPVRARVVADEAAVIRAVALLRFDEAADRPVARVLRGAAGADAILSAVMRFDTTPARWMRELDLVSALTGQAVVWDVVRSWSVAAGIVAECLSSCLSRHPETP